MSQSSYIELHARSAFSFLRGGSLPEQLAQQAAAIIGLGQRCDDVSQRTVDALAAYEQKTADARPWVQRWPNWPLQSPHSPGRP